MMAIKAKLPLKNSLTLFGSVLGVTTSSGNNPVSARFLLFVTGRPKTQSVEAFNKCLFHNNFVAIIV